MISPFRRRDALAACAAGVILAFALNIWFNFVARPDTIDRYMWLAWLQEPGAQFGEWLARFLYQRVGYPWNVRWAVLCGYAVLIVMWTLVVFVAIGFCRLTAAIHRGIMKRAC